MYFDGPVPPTSIQEYQMSILPECPNGTEYYCIVPSIFYNTFQYHNITIPIRDVFYFSDEVIRRAQLMLSIPHYISIHLRMGDQFLETDPSFVMCTYDVRVYDENSIFQFIELHSHTPIIFFCDNHSYKLKIKHKYNHVTITDSNIGHTSLHNTTDSQVLDTVAEFYLLTVSDAIYCASSSGFSVVASLFNRIPLQYI